MPITGSEKLIFSSKTLLSSEQSVSPVDASKPTPATISPAKASLISSL